MKLDLDNLRKRLRARSALAITIESGRVVVSLVRNEETEPQPAPSFALPLGDEELLKDPESAGHQLVAALASAGVRERRCVVCVPAGWALTASTDLPAVAGEDLRGYLELRAEREFSISAAELRLGYSAYALPNGQRRATLAALPRKKIEAIERMLEIARRRASSISLALERCLSQPQAMLHFLTNGNHTDLVVTAGGGVAGLRSLPGPHASGGVAFDPAGFCRDVRITLGRLPEPVRQQIRNAEFSGPSADKLCFQTRQDLLRLGIKSAECHAAAGVPGAAEDASAAAEAARLKLRGEDVPFEFVVPETKRWQELLQRVDTSRRRGLLLGAAALVLLPLLLLFIRSEIESHLEARWNAMAGDVADLRLAATEYPAVSPVVRDLPATPATAREPGPGLSRPGRRMGKEHPGRRGWQGHLHRLRQDTAGADGIAGPNARPARYHRAPGPANPRRQPDPVLHQLSMGGAP